MSVIDPVCGMEVDPQKTKYKSVYKGKVYYFCSYQCKKAFDENPEYYLVSGPRREFMESRG
jgi:YHS domain-containing protein